MRFRKLIRWTALAGVAGAVLLVLGVLFAGLITLGCDILGLLLIRIAGRPSRRRPGSRSESSGAHPALSPSRASRLRRPPREEP